MFSWLNYNHSYTYNDSLLKTYLNNLQSTALSYRYFKTNIDCDSCSTNVWFWLEFALLLFQHKMSPVTSTKHYWFQQFRGAFHCLLVTFKHGDNNIFSYEILQAAHIALNTNAVYICVSAQEGVWKRVIFCSRLSWRLQRFCQTVHWIGKQTHFLHHATLFCSKNKLSVTNITPSDTALFIVARC